MIKKKKAEQGFPIGLATVCVFLALFVLYTSMLSREYSTANYGVDGGDLLSAILTNGVPHPSGYPAYLLIGKLFQALPFVSPYFKASLISSFFSALAAGLLVWYAGTCHFKELTRSKRLLPAICAGISLGISALFWSQAVIVEVYGLTMFFFVCMLTWTGVVMHSENKSSDIGLSLLSILIGFGLGTHLLLGLMSPVLLYATFSPGKKNQNIKKFIKYFFLMALAAISTYMILLFRSRGNPPVNWGNPRDLKGLLWLVTGRLYQGLAFRIPGSEIFPRIRYVVQMLLEQFWYSGLLLGLLGSVRFLSSSDKAKYIYLWILLTYSVFSIGYLTNDSVVYLMPVFAVFALMIGDGIVDLAERTRQKPYLAQIIIGSVFLASLIIRMPAIQREVDPRLEKTARQSAEACLGELPENAILLTSEDKDTFPLWYYHFGLGWREDLSILVKPLLAYDWYRENIRHQYPEIVLPEVYSSEIFDSLKEKNTGRAICESNDTPPENENRFLCQCRD